MELQVVGKNLEISPEVEAYVQKKIGKLARFMPTIAEAKVEIEEARTKSPQHRFTVQVTLDSKGTLLRAEERGESAAAAVDAVAEVLARQIERYKGKLYKRVKGNSIDRLNSAPDELAAIAERDKVPKVVKVKRFSVKPMSVEEAAEQMELLGHDFFFFINSGTEAPNLLYRRNDGDYGLIEPE